MPGHNNREASEQVEVRVIKRTSLFGRRNVLTKKKKKIPFLNNRNKTREVESVGGQLK